MGIIAIISITATRWMLIPLLIVISFSLLLQRAFVEASKIIRYSCSHGKQLSKVENIGMCIPFLTHSDFFYLTSLD